MCAGVTPFRGDTSGLIFNAILERDPVAPVRINLDVRAELERIITKCREKDRDLRYQGAAELRADLKRLKRDTESKKVLAECFLVQNPTSGFSHSSTIRIQRKCPSK